MVSADAYLKAVAAIVTLGIALVVLTARPRRGAIPLAAFLALIALNQGAETIRALVATEEERVVWFRVASVAASLDPFAFAWFATSVVPRVMQRRSDAWIVGGVGAALAIYGGWALTAIPGADAGSHAFPLALSAYTAIVYVGVLLRAASGIRALGAPVGQAALLAGLLVAAIPAAPRPLEELFTFVEPVLQTVGLGGSFFPLLLAIAAVLSVLLLLFSRELASDTRRAARSAAIFAVVLAIIARAAHIVSVVGNATGAPAPADLFLLGRIEAPVRWLLFGALGSVAVFGTELLEVPIEVRRRAARLLVALGFLVIGGSALAIAGIVFGERPLDAFYLAVLGGAVALSQGFRRLVEATASRLYGVPIPTDTESAHTFYRRAVAEVLARGGAPARDPGLEHVRRSLDIDRASAAAIESMVEESTRAPISPGRLVAGRYQVERMLGRGGSGRAFVASDLRIARSVVLKEVVSDRLEDRDAALREAQLIGALAHPHVLTIHDVLPRAHGWILVTEYADGGTLGDAMRAEALDVHERAVVARALVDAVASVHERGIVHGDIKPQNVVLTARGVAKLADFGTARANARSTVHAREVLGGTPTYMAPELRRGSPPTTASDVYALGILLRALLGPSPDAASTIQRALSEEPSARWPSAVEMRAAFLASAPIHEK